MYPESRPVTYQSPKSPSSESVVDHGDREYEAILQWIGMAKVLTTVVNYAETGARNLVRIGREGAEARHKGDVALRRFIGDLKEIYRDVFARDPGHSRPSRGGAPYGPFVRFVEAALRPLGVEISTEKIADLIRSRKHRKKTHQSKC
jgi:hypothetical protein